MLKTDSTFLLYFTLERGGNCSVKPKMHSSQYREPCQLSANSSQKNDAKPSHSGTPGLINACQPRVTHSWLTESTILLLPQCSRIEHNYILLRRVGWFSFTHKSSAKFQTETVFSYAIIKV